MAGLLTSAQLAQITATVASSLDQSLLLERVTRSPDAYGSRTEIWASVGNVACNVKSPTATQLQVYAEIIGSQRSLVLRVMNTTDIRENDRVTYDSLKWRVHGIENADSYTVTKEYIIVVIT